MTGGQRLHVVRYLSGMVFSAVMIFSLVWTYIVTFPMAFLPSGYPVWAAKKHMLDSCDLGMAMLFGNSQLEAGIVAHGLPLVSTNFSAGGVSPLDSYFLVHQALACPNVPKHAILSFGFNDFLQIQEAIWANPIRYGILGASAISDMEATGRRLGDSSFDDYVTIAGFSGWSRNVIFTLRLPFLYFDSLVRGGFFLRETNNRALFVDALAKRGQMPYNSAQAADPPNRNRRSPAPGFKPLPIQIDYFERIIAAMDSGGVSIDFIIMPVPRARAMSLHIANLEVDFIDYLRRVERRHPNFHLSQSTIPVWLDENFVDEIHLNPGGAAQFTARLNNCLRLTDQDWKSGTYARACELSNGPATIDAAPSRAQ